MFIRTILVQKCTYLMNSVSYQSYKIFLMLLLISLVEIKWKTINKIKTNAVSSLMEKTSQVTNILRSLFILYTSFPLCSIIQEYLSERDINDEPIMSNRYILYTSIFFWIKIKLFFFYINDIQYFHVNR